MASNNLQWLICHKTKPNQTKPNQTKPNQTKQNYFVNFILFKLLPQQRFNDPPLFKPGAQSLICGHFK